MKELLASATIIGITIVSLPNVPSDAAVKQYIVDSLVNGCRPIVDICTDSCKARLDLSQISITDGCIVDGDAVLRVSQKRATDLYLEIAEENNIKFDRLEQLPGLIRAQQKRLGRTLKPLKEPLVVKK